MKKIEPVTGIWIFVCTMNFWAARNGKNWNFGLVRPNLHELGLFHLYFLYKCSFREISIIKIVILDQSKQMSLILKMEKSKIQNSKICKLYVYYSQKWKLDKYTIPTQSDSTSFMFNNIFCEKNIEKVIHWGGGPGTFSSLVFSYFH